MDGFGPGPHGPAMSWIEYVATSGPVQEATAAVVDGEVLGSDVADAIERADAFTRGHMEKWDPDNAERLQERARRATAVTFEALPEHVDAMLGACVVRGDR